MNELLQYIQKRMNYDYVVNGCVYRGNCDYVCSHLNDGYGNISISDVQPKDIKEFVLEYKKVYNSVSMEDFYNSHPELVKNLVNTKKYVEFEQIYHQVFDCTDEVRACGRNLCKKLIKIADEIEPNKSHGDLEDGFMDIDAIKALKRTI